MQEPTTDFIYDRKHGVLICRVCATCLSPRSERWAVHLRADPHRMQGQTLKAMIEKFRGYDLRTEEQLFSEQPFSGRPCPLINGLTVYEGYRCAYKGCKYFTVRLVTLKYKHLPRVHNEQAQNHRAGHVLWQASLLQTYFPAKGRIRYFPVYRTKCSEAAATTGTDNTLFQALQDDIQRAKEETRELGNIVPDAEENRTARVPWLEMVGFTSHIGGIHDEEVKASYKLPPKKSVNSEDLLGRILAVADAMLWDAYALCSSTSPGRRMTHQRAKILNEFYEGASTSGRLDGFRSFKNASSLESYFGRMKELMVYFFRVVYRGGHFTRERDGQVLPSDVLRPTEEQRRAMDELVVAVQQDDGTDENWEASLVAKSAAKRFYIALVCQQLGSSPFQSPVLSFCAMQGRRMYRQTKDDESEGKREAKSSEWHEPAAYNSTLSALTWTAQLVLFVHVCDQAQDNDDQVPVLLREFCRTYFQQLAETPFGYILQWRLYLFAVAKNAVAKHQARWSLDGETIEYRGTELRMSQIVQLIEAEYRQAHSILYDNLLLGMADLPTIESWKLRDDLDESNLGSSWLTDPRNAALLAGADTALLHRLCTAAELRNTFVRTAEDGRQSLCLAAIDVYEACVQDFLRRLLVLCHLPPGPPLRAPEILSVTVCNTARQRHVFIWEKLVMVYVQYHKGQEQSGRYKDNIRFLPKPVGDLLLTYLAYVQPLRQTFLRQRQPTALLSPYLWSSLEGKVWKDEKLSACLRRACARAEVPQFQTAWWRQVAASITKEKFAPRDLANFDLDDLAGEEVIEDELNLVALAEMSNHSFPTFNHAYAGSTTLTMNTLLHRSYRASESWRRLFRADLLQVRRQQTDANPPILLDAKRTRFRRRDGHSEAELLAVACRMHNDSAFQYRTLGQRRALLAALGPRPAEQVVVVLATGSGKTLLPMIGALLDGVGTTILVLPTVALRGNIIKDRLPTLGIRYRVWAPGSTKSAPLVLIAAESVCTESFLSYAHRLVARQELARIVVDECHLTVTASSYRLSMSQLGWFVRQIKTQTVWMTATLPPVLLPQFIERNLLVRPHIVRESTNRPNIRYLIQRERGCGTLVDRAAQFLHSYLQRAGWSVEGPERIIVYCQSKELVAELASLLNCLSYTADSGTSEEKDEIVASWLHHATHSPIIVATSALGVGFDYPHVRCVLHIGTPKSITDFSQESGRAGRDGQPADSVVLVSAAWSAAVSSQLPVDEEAMQLYITQLYCARGVLSQFLDVPDDWLWCMEGEQLCGACQEPHAHPRPAGLVFSLPGTADEQLSFTGPSEAARQACLQEAEFNRYERDLEVLRGGCLYCRVEGRPFEHAASVCSRRNHWTKPKGEAIAECRKAGKEWIQPHLVCWTCFQPQEICLSPATAVQRLREPCRFPDMIMPVCYGAFCRRNRTAWFQEHFQRKFRTSLEYMLWLGEPATLGGIRCIQANRVAALMFAEMA